MVSHTLLPPSLKRSSLYRALRWTRRRALSHLESIKLQRRAERGAALVPEAALEARYVALLRELRAAAGNKPLGDYLEFGVCHGASLACMHRALATLAIAEVRLFGFDSFAGLPPEAETDEGSPWYAGQYRSSEAFTRRFLDRAGVDWSRVILVKGWYQDTLTEALVERHSIRQASVIMVDCDLYSSARLALAFCAPLIHDHAAVLFDDWHSGGDLAALGLGEKRAFDEFLAANPELVAVEAPSYCTNAAVFMVSRKGSATECAWNPGQV